MTLLDQAIRALIAYRKANGYTRALMLNADGTMLLSTDEMPINIRVR